VANGSNGVFDTWNSSVRTFSIGKGESWQYIAFSHNSDKLDNFGILGLIFRLDGL